jgi:hypothetical protein
MIFVLMMFSAFLALSFAPGLTYWKRMPTFKAIFYSVFAVIGSARALVTMVLCMMGIYWIMGMVIGITMGRSQIVFVVLAWLNLIFALVFQCATYAAYKQILGMPESAPDKSDA